MDEFEKTIRNTLSNSHEFDAQKAQTLRKETIQMYDKNLKKYRRLTWVCLIAFAIIGVATIEIMVVWGSNLRVLIIGGIVLLGVGQLEVLMKLWYWIMNNKLNVLKEIKQLQLQIAELTNQPPTSED